MSQETHSLRANEDQIRQIFGNTEIAFPEPGFQAEFETAAKVGIQFGHTGLGVKENPEAPGVEYFITGNTVPRLCGAMGACAANSCGLGARQMSIYDRQELDCAVANTAEVFGGRMGFVITPTNNEAVFMWDEDVYEPVTARDSRNVEVTMFNKVKAGSVFVFSEQDLPKKAGNEVFIAANNADNSFMIATTEIEGLRYVLAASSSRLNLGDRDQDAQIFRKAVNGILDRHELKGEARQTALAAFKMDIHVGYSASLKNFKHDVRLPEEGSDAANKLIQANGLSSYAELTPTIVMSGKSGQYPGALEHGEVYGALEAENDIDAPRGPGGCPGFGEYCYIHYPKITERTIVDQLIEMGMNPENVTYDASNVIDPAAEDNRLASNRRMQLAGFTDKQTLRSVNGAAIVFPSREQWEFFSED